MQNGAFNFLTKPLNLEQLEITVKRALQGRELKIQNQQLKKEIDSEKAVDSLIGNSPAMQKVMTLVKKVADARISVLITGESGVGKSVLVSAIHSLSSRKSNPLVTVHCAALSETLLESELFGHEKGAFTGAESLHKGKFELAHGGTIFLDEIGEINQNVQVKLLRVLQERKFERVGGEQTLEVDVRVIAATNKNLEEEVKAGRFREDLYFRLNGIKIEVPPLRDRKDDIPLLLNSFLTKFNKENSKDVKGFDNKSRSAIYKYDWPGNIRELEHCVESSVVMASGDMITLEDLPPTVSRSSSGEAISVPLGITMDEAEKIIIMQNLVANNGNKSKTADVLGIGRKTLHRKLAEYGIDEDSETSMADLIEREG